MNLEFTCRRQIRKYSYKGVFEWIMINFSTLCYDMCFIKSNAILDKRPICEKKIAVNLDICRQFLIWAAAGQAQSWPEKWESSRISFFIFNAQLWKYKNIKLWHPRKQTNHYYQKEDKGCFIQKSLSTVF